MDASFFTSLDPTLLLLIIIWTMPWKGVALWKAARQSDQKWFIVLLVVNTLAILEILYIFIFSKRLDNAHRGHTAPQGPDRGGDSGPSPRHSGLRPRDGGPDRHSHSDGGSSHGTT